MLIYLDESGTFAGYHKGSIGVVGALVIPYGNLRRLRRKFARIRPSLLIEGNEVKGRLLGEHDVNRVVRLLATREAFFEVTALDLGLHTEAGVLAFRQKLAAETRAKLATFPEALRGRANEAVDYLDTMTPQLFLQALTTFELIHRVISHAILYFSQRRPYELSSFTWVVDGKDRAKVTLWENWLKFYRAGRPHQSVTAQSCADAESGHPLSVQLHVPRRAHDQASDRRKELGYQSAPAEFQLQL